VEVPSPILPEASILILSAPPVAKPKMSVSIRYKPVLVSLVKAREGAAAVPSAKKIFPVTVRLEPTPPLPVTVRSP